MLRALVQRFTLMGFGRLRGVPQRWGTHTLNTSVRFLRSNKNAVRKPEPKSPQHGPNAALRWISILITGTVLYSLFTTPKWLSARFISWHEFVSEMLSKGEVRAIIIRPDSDMAAIILHEDAIIKGKPIKDPVRFITIESTTRFEEKIRQAEKQLGIKPEDMVSITYQRSSSLWNLAVFCAICLFLYGIFKNVRFSVSITSGLDAMRGFGKARFREFDARVGKRQDISFRNVAGLKEAKVEIKEFVSYLQEPARYKELGAKLPRGALLLGPPGCGKTLLAKALSSEAQVPFLSIAGSEFIEVVGGLGAARVRDLFSEARKRSPCIIYIDELDALGKRRASGKGLAYASGEEEQTLNQLLVEMDGLESSKNVIVVIASTNRPDVLDRALLRPGRFDRHIWIDLPTKIEREEILELHLSSIRLSPGYDKKELASELAALTAGMSGADLANLCNEAALQAALASQKDVVLANVLAALDRVQFGVAKKSTTLSASERRSIAIRESGRVAVAWMLKHADQISKVSIVQRIGKNAFKGAHFIPSDAKITSQDELLDQMAILLGGRAAEQAILQHVSTGDEDDLKRVTKSAYDQIIIYGMSSRIGPVSFNPDDQFARKPYSKAMQFTIDQEVRNLIYQAQNKAETIIGNNIQRVEQLATELLRKESVSLVDIESLWGCPVPA